jgi:hypothetical protein
MLSLKIQKHRAITIDSVVNPVNAFLPHNFRIKRIFNY